MLYNLDETVILQELFYKKKTNDINSRELSIVSQNLKTENHLIWITWQMKWYMKRQITSSVNMSLSYWDSTNMKF